MRFRFSALFLLLSLLAAAPLPALAGNRSFTREVTPSRSGVFEQKDEDVVALARARRNILSDAGAWLAAFPEVKEKRPDSGMLPALAAAVVTVHARGQGESGANRMILSIKIGEGEARKTARAVLSDPVLFGRYRKVAERERLLLSRVEDVESQLAALPEPRSGQAVQILKSAYAQCATQLAAVSLMFMAHDVFLKGGKSKDPQKALEYYSGAARLDPGYADAFGCRGLVNLSQGRYQEAISDYTQAISLAPDDADLHQDRGVAFGEMGRPDLAVKDFSQAITLRPGFTRAWAARGFAYLIMNEDGQGCKDLKKACDMGECLFLQGARAQGRCR